MALEDALVEREKRWLAEAKEAVRLKSQGMFERVYREVEAELDRLNHWKPGSTELLMVAVAFSKLRAITEQGHRNPAKFVEFEMDMDGKINFAPRVREQETVE